jgi:hypothetical protein
VGLSDRPEISRVERSIMLRNVTCSAGRWRTASKIAIAAVVLVGATAATISAAPDDSAPNPVATSDADPGNSTAESRPDKSESATGGGGRINGYLAGGRWREGSKLVDVAGHFKTSGERVAFHAADGKSRFPCLENLNSERVARIVAESPPESLEWIVQGTLTEFRNENYLLVTQAVISSRAVRGPRPTVNRRVPEAKESRTQR